MMEQDLEPGDFLIFQLEAGFALLRLLAVDEDKVWHLAAYAEFFPSIESAEEAIERGELKISVPHAALTQRAFESTQVARVANQPLTDGETGPLHAWRTGTSKDISDRSIRLLLGLR
jgi:hypothetical protein